MDVTLMPNHLYYVGQALDPAVELIAEDGSLRQVALSWVGEGRHANECLWVADLTGRLPQGPDPWQFCLDLGDGRFEHPEFAPYFTTSLRSVWLQDGELFGYRPTPLVSPSRVVKIEAFAGSLPERALYVYLPRGYDEHEEKRYPVLYMHDGQNCFEAFVDDSFAGSWQADLAADLLIRQGLMQECIIVGVSNGAEQRIMEYLPPYARHAPPSRRPFQAGLHGEEVQEAPRRPLLPAPGWADRTFAYYRNEIAPYIARNYRVLPGRDNTATCGSSMGGLFSLYIAWEHPEFARSHAVLSTSFWATRNQKGALDAIERLRRRPPHDVRLWLDSGTRSTPERGDDGLRDTLKARKALLEAGYVEGSDFHYYRAEGATHSEASWAARLPMILQFLLPITDQA